MTTPLERGDLGDDDLCPYCEQPQADFSLVYFRQRPVCATCAPILSNLRRERHEQQGRHELRAVAADPH